MNPWIRNNLEMVCWVTVLAIAAAGALDYWVEAVKRQERRQMGNRK